MEYIIRIDGDFEKGDCYSCPLAYGAEDMYGDSVSLCSQMVSYEDCPLEEVKQGEWDEECRCTACGWYGEDWYKRDAVWFKFCPECGTPMKGGK